jgi:hypothetical protein
MEITNYTNYKYNAEVLEILNGNSLMAKIDLGFNKTHKCIVELFELDSPHSSVGSVKKLTELLELNKNKFILNVERFDGSDKVIGEIYAGWTYIYPWPESQETRPVLMSINEILIKDIKILSH